jgi:hypothetical protein
MHAAARRLNLARLIGKKKIRPAQSELKTRRQHSDYCVCASPEIEVLSDDVFISTEMTLPKRVTQNDYSRSTLYIVAGPEELTTKRLHAQHRKEIG